MTNSILLWSAYEDGCFIDYTSNSGNGQAVVLTGEGTSGAVADPEFSPGVVTCTMQCGAQIASTAIDWVPTAPPASLSVATATRTTGLESSRSFSNGFSGCSLPSPFGRQSSRTS